MQKTFTHFDTDNDGFITQEELSSMAKEKVFDCNALAVKGMCMFPHALFRIVQACGDHAEDVCPL